MVSYITEVVLFAVAMTAILFAIVLIRPSTSEDNYESAVAQFCVNNWGGGGGGGGRHSGKVPTILRGIQTTIFHPSKFGGDHPPLSPGNCAYVSRIRVSGKYLQGLYGKLYFRAHNVGMQGRRHA